MSLGALKKFLYENKTTLLTIIKNAGIISVFVILILIIHKNVYSIVLEQGEYRIETKKMRISNLPEWVKKEMKISHIIIRGPNETESTIDPKLLAKLKAMLEAHPCIKRVVHLKREFPNKIKIEFQVRKPEYLVKYKGKDYVIDDDFVLLPGEPAKSLLADKPYITGIQTPPPKPGKRWVGEDISCAVEMVKIIKNNAVLNELGIVAVDVSNFKGRISATESHITFILRSGARILWGKTPKPGQIDEVSLKEKIKNIEIALNNYPNMEGVELVRVYLPQYPSVKERNR